jgi:hypothetical protein
LRSPSVPAFFNVHCYIILILVHYPCPLKNFPCVWTKFLLFSHFFTLFLTVVTPLLFPVNSYWWWRCSNSEHVIFLNSVACGHVLTVFKSARKNCTYRIFGVLWGNELHVQAVCWENASCNRWIRTQGTENHIYD